MERENHKPPWTVHEQYQSIASTVWQDMQPVRPLHKFQCDTEEFNEETIFVMGLEFDFNPWWEAQVVSKPIGNINTYLKGLHERAWASQNTKLPSPSVS